MFRKIVCDYLIRKGYIMRGISKYIIIGILSLTLLFAIVACGGASPTNEESNIGGKN